MTAHDTALVTLAIVGNVLNLAYNVPFVYRVWTLWDAENLSTYFLAMRVSGSVAFLAYGALLEDARIAGSFAVTLISSLLLLVVKYAPARPCDGQRGQQPAQSTSV